MSRLDEERLRVKLIVIGNAGAGKSSLVRKYVHDDFRGDQRRTSVANTELKTVVGRRGKTVDVEIWDTAGQERYDSLTGNYYRGADGCLIVYDVLKQPSFDAVQKWNRKRLEYRSADDVMPAILVAAKSDLRSASSGGVQAELGRKLARELDVPYYEVTCTSSESVSGLFEKIVDLVLESRVKRDAGASMLGSSRVHLQKILDYSTDGGGGGSTSSDSKKCC